MNTVSTRTLSFWGSHQSFVDPLQKLKSVHEIISLICKTFSTYVDQRVFYFFQLKYVTHWRKLYERHFEIVSMFFLGVP